MNHSFIAIFISVLVKHWIAMMKSFVDLKETYVQKLYQVILNVLILPLLSLMSLHIFIKSFYILQSPPIKSTWQIINNNSTNLDLQ